MRRKKNSTDLPKAQPGQQPRRNAAYSHFGYSFRHSAVPWLAGPQFCGRFATRISAACAASPSPKTLFSSIETTRKHPPLIGYATGQSGVYGYPVVRLKHRLFRDVKGVAATLRDIRPRSQVATNPCSCTRCGRQAVAKPHRQNAQGRPHARDHFLQ